MKRSIQQTWEENILPWIYLHTHSDTRSEGNSWRTVITNNIDGLHLQDIGVPAQGVVAVELHPELSVVFHVTDHARVVRVVTLGEHTVTLPVRQVDRLSLARRGRRYVSRGTLTNR